MAKLNSPAVHHVISLENDFTEVPNSAHWTTREPSGYSRASCTCGELDTDFVGTQEATAAAREHAATYLPDLSFRAHSDEEPSA